MRRAAPAAPAPPLSSLSAVPSSPLRFAAQRARQSARPRDGLRRPGRLFGDGNRAGRGRAAVARRERSARGARRGGAGRALRRGHHRAQRRAPRGAPHRGQGLCFCTGRGGGVAFCVATRTRFGALLPCLPLPTWRHMAPTGGAAWPQVALCKMRGAALKLGQILSMQDESVIPPQVRPPPLRPQGPLPLRRPRPRGSAPACSAPPPDPSRAGEGAAGSRRHALPPAIPGAALDSPERQPSRQRSPCHGA